MYIKKIEEIREKIFSHLNKILKNNLEILDNEKNAFNNLEDFLCYIGKNYLNNKNNKTILFIYNYFRENNGFTKERFIKKFSELYFTK